MRSEFRDRLIRVALEQGYLDEERVRVAFSILATEEQKGAKPKLHEILVRYNLMTRGQLLEVRREMAREGMPMRIGDFEMVSRLGRGSMGTVYRARQRSLDREVALKVLAEHLAVDEQIRESFFREARLAARVTHKNIVQIFDVGDTRHTHYFVMEYVAGRTLERILAKEGRIAEAQATGIALQMARALVAMESGGIVHRDIKPGNIMITRDGTAKLADLGMAILSDGTEKVAGGTAWYMPPEQARNGPAPDIRTDMYALGCTLFHAVIGQPPYAGRNAAETLRMHAEAPIPDAAGLRDDVSSGFSQAVRRMMAKTPEGRFANAAELLAAWGTLAGGETPQLDERPVGGIRKKAFLLWIVVGAIGVVLLLVLLWAFLKERFGPASDDFGAVPGVEFTAPADAESGGR